MKLNFKTENGITLIALIITIIILVILAAVSIRTVYNMGIVNHAVNGTAEYVEQSKQEEKMMDDTESFLDDTIAKIKAGASLEKTNATQPYLPSSDFKQVTGTSLSEGLVIEDTSTAGKGNQFVWVEVPNDGTGPVYPSGTTETSYTEIETALKAYASDYRDETNYQDVYYDGCGIASQSEYEELYHKMLSSIYTYGGFWIGRYETGISQSDTNGPRMESNVSTPQKAVVTKDAYPYNYVTQSQAQSLAEGINSGECESSLLFGIQWDLVLRYLEAKGTNQSLLTEDSTTWGNYYNAEFAITSTSAKYAPSDGYDLGTWTAISTDTSGTVESSTKLEAGALLTTGANDTRNAKMNICDLAGNVREWTLEARGSTSGSTFTPDSYYPCTTRGGVYDNGGDYGPACNRGDNNTTGSGDYVGLRATLFK